jgi:hypothetical protein
MANVAAELRQRDKDLSGIGDEITVAAVAQCGGDRHQRGEIAAIGEGEGFPGEKPGARFGAGEKGGEIHKTIPPCRGGGILAEERVPLAGASRDDGVVVA